MVRRNEAAVDGKARLIKNNIPKLHHYELVPDQINLSHCLRGW